MRSFLQVFRDKGVSFTVRIWNEAGSAFIARESTIVDAIQHGVRNKCDIYIEHLDIRLFWSGFTQPAAGVTEVKVFLPEKGCFARVAVEDLQSDQLWMLVPGWMGMRTVPKFRQLPMAFVEVVNRIGEVSILKGPVYLPGSLGTAADIVGWRSVQADNKLNGLEAALEELRKKHGIAIVQDEAGGWAVKEVDKFADQKAAYELDAKFCDTPWIFWKSIADTVLQGTVENNLLKPPEWDVRCDYVRKPTIVVNGIEVPEPLKERKHTMYCVDLNADHLYTMESDSLNAALDNSLARGLVHTSADAAIWHAKALLKWEN